MASSDQIQVLHVVDGTMEWVPLVDVFTTTAESVTKQYFCTASEAIGDAVYISGADTVAQASAASSGTMPAIGMIVSKPSVTECVVILYGELLGFSGLLPGQQYFISTLAGQITVTPPSADGQVVQRIGVASSSTALTINPVVDVML